MRTKPSLVVSPHSIALAASSMARWFEMSLTKPFKRLWRTLLVYGIYPLFNRGISKVYLSARPDELGIRFEPSLAKMRPLWEFERKGNNRADQARLFFFMQNVAELRRRHVPGDFAELGVYKGNTARILRELAPDRTLYLFDTFEGFDGKHAANDPSAADAGDYSCSLEAVRAFVGDGPRVHYIKGRFPDTAKQLPDTARFALVHLDCDLYEPMKAAVDFFLPRLEAGGMLIIHDYAGTAWPGVKQAVDEALADTRDHVVVIPDRSGTGVVVKSGLTEKL